MAKPKFSGETQQELLRAALKRFAHAGYAATSVQQIVADAKVSKPTLYYYFGDKAGLFRALVTAAFEERYRIMREAVGRVSGFREQLVEIMAGLFEYFRRNRELMRISLATAFAAPGEVPPGLRHLEKAMRNFEFIHALFKAALQRGDVDSRFESRELALGFFGQMNLYLMSHLLMPDQPLDRRTAERIVDLFLSGAAPAARKAVVADDSSVPRRKPRVPATTRSKAP